MKHCNNYFFIFYYLIYFISQHHQTFINYFILSTQLNSTCVCIGYIIRSVNIENYLLLYEKRVFLQVIRIQILTGLHYRIKYVIKITIKNFKIYKHYLFFLGVFVKTKLYS